MTTQNDRMPPTPTPQFVRYIYIFDSLFIIYGFIETDTFSGLKNSYLD